MLVRRGKEAGELGHRFALDPHRHRKGADFQIAHAPTEHLAHQVARIALAQRAGAVLATADLSDVRCDGHAESLASATSGRDFQARTPAMAWRQPIADL